MTTKERLHRLIDTLSESEAQRAIAFVGKQQEDPMIAAFENAPEDDEPLSAEEQAGVEESHADLAAGRTFSLQEVRHELFTDTPPR